MYACRFCPLTASALVLNNAMNTQWEVRTIKQQNLEGDHHISIISVSIGEVNTIYLNAEQNCH